MLSPFIKKLGISYSVVLVTILATFLSFGISSSINFLRTGSLLSYTSVNAVIIPLILTPLIAVSFFRVLFQLDEVSHKLEELSNTDELTKVHNRRYFFGKLNQEFSRAKRYNQVFSIIMIDVDDFKLVNDEFGHPVGDELLIVLARLCRDKSREVDEFARIGGDEFAYLLPGLDQQGAEAFADRLRLLLSKYELTQRDTAIHITVSIGVISWTPEHENINDMLIQLDAALQQAKANGKNKVATNTDPLLTR
jgi:diguanylate cyclase (GGDEF)-like protein